MNPSEYEMRVAERFRLRGYSVQCTPASDDYGVDVFATKGTERLAIQAKMYGSASRSVNRDVVMHLHGAKDYFGCTAAIIVTDDGLMDDATAVARKLHIEVLVLSADQMPVTTEGARPAPDKYAFDAIWQQHIMPLAGSVLHKSDGGSNTLIEVNRAGVKRRTSNDKLQFISIDIFKKAIAALLSNGEVSRDFINQMYPKRASSGILLILSQIPLFERVSSPLGLRLRAEAQDQLAAWGIEIGPPRRPHHKR